MDSALASRFMQSRLLVTGEPGNTSAGPGKGRGSGGPSAHFPGEAYSPEAKKTQKSMDANSPMTSPTTAVSGDKLRPCSLDTR